MLVVYFSGTGNTEYLAKTFAAELNAECISIETEIDFTKKFQAHEQIAFCYPIYGSRVPRIMRDFVLQHQAEIISKKLVIFATQMIFSGDGSRVFTDLFVPNEVEVIYTEHFNMPNNICNTPMLRPPSNGKLEKYQKKIRLKVAHVAKDIMCGTVKKRGFSNVSKMLGNIQGKPWINRIERRAKNGIKFHDDCTKCGICIQVCPMKNLVIANGKMQQLGDCTVCYRCINKCPKQAITVFIHRRPKWQYHGINKTRGEN